MFDIFENKLTTQHDSSPSIEVSNCESDVSVRSVELDFQHHSCLCEEDIVEDSVLDDLKTLSRHTYQV